MGYIDQYIVFPKEVKARIKDCPADTLFVFTDHSLGAWIPLAAKNNHIIHCHDFLAQYSAMDKIIENPVSWTGKLYQGFIRNGFKKGKNFISVSNKTRDDLHKFIGYNPRQSGVIYNGLSQIFKPENAVLARLFISNKTGLTLTQGYLLHVGSDQWYKNRIGVIEIYDELRKAGDYNLSLLMIGNPAGGNLLKRKNISPFCNDIHIIGNMDIDCLRMAYCGASVFLFPSLAEGFGWPIAEAMACGCPVVTTREAPMTEVAGEAGFFILRRPHNYLQAAAWAVESAKVVAEILHLSPSERNKTVECGIKNAARFDLDIALNLIENSYKKVLDLV